MVINFLKGNNIYFVIGWFWAKVLFYWKKAKVTLAS